MHHAGLAVGVDIGGTKVAAGLVAADGSVLERVRRETPEAAGRIELLVADVARELAASAGLDRVPVGVGAAGLVDQRGVIRYAPNIDWVDYPLGQILAADLGWPVTMDNDANVAAWGEYCHGAASGAKTSMVMLTIGTGVGGGLVMENRLVRGVNGMAAEFGHMTVTADGPECGCGQRGHLEALSSGTAIGRRARERLKDGEAPADCLLLALPVDEVTGKTVTVAAHRGDPFSRSVLAEAGTWLGVGIASLVNALDPEVVVVGGGAMEAGDLLLGPAVVAADAHVLGRAHRDVPPIVRAQLADDAGIVGAAMLALDAEP